MSDQLPCIDETRTVSDTAQRPLPQGLFIAGTDTGVGKSVVSAALLHHYRHGGEQVVGMKPIASGAGQTGDGLRNDDALLLQHHSNLTLPYELINPYCFAPAIAPHIAAQQARVSISIDTIVDHYQQLANLPQRVIVEGVGGWQVPINNQQTMADLAVALDLPVVLVVGLRLGAINHTLLSVQSIEGAGLPLAGWVANCIDPEMAVLDENIASVEGRINAPLLGVLPYRPPADIALMAKILALGIETHLP